MPQDIFFCARTGGQIIDDNVVHLLPANTKPRPATIGEIPLCDDERHAIRRKLVAVLTPRELEAVREAWPAIDDI